MRLIIWNIRGCNKPFKQKELKLFLQVNKVDVAVILETRVKIGKAQKIIERICRSWSSINNYRRAENGRIWILWNPKKVQITMLEDHEQEIHCELLDTHSGKGNQLIVVYALNTSSQRKGLWEFITSRTQSNQAPLIIGGDFNAVLQVEDRFQGSTVTSADVDEFQQCFDMNDLKEVRAVGAHYTWTNNQEHEHLICANIDKCFANYVWFDEFSQVVVERLARSISDHCPQLLDFGFGSPRGKLFKFYNVWADHAEFEGLVRSAWEINTSTNLLQDIWFKCRRLREPLKQLNIIWFKKIAERMENLRQHLLLIQQNLSVQHSTRLRQEEKEWVNLRGGVT